MINKLTLDSLSSIHVKKEEAYHAAVVLDGCDRYWLTLLRDAFLNSGMNLPGVVARELISDNINKQRHDIQKPKKAVLKHVRMRSDFLLLCSW